MCFIVIDENSRFKETNSQALNWHCQKQNLLRLRNNIQILETSSKKFNYCKVIFQHTNMLIGNSQRNDFECLIKCDYRSGKFSLPIQPWCSPNYRECEIRENRFRKIQRTWPCHKFKLFLKKRNQIFSNNWSIFKSNNL